MTGRDPVTRDQLLQHLPPILASDTLLVTEANAAYRAFARKTGITHACVDLRAGLRVRGALHVQNANGYHSRFPAWLRPFHGNARRYLPNNLGGRWAIDLERIRSPETLLKVAIGVFHSERIQRQKFDNVSLPDLTPALGTAVHFVR